MPKKSTARYSPRAQRESGPLAFRPVANRTPQIHTPVVSPDPRPPRVIRQMGRLMPGDTSVGAVVRSFPRPIVTAPVPPGVARVQGAQPTRVVGQAVQRGPLTPIQQQVPRETPSAGPREPAQPPVVASAKAPVEIPARALGKAPAIHVGNAADRIAAQEARRTRPNGELNAVKKHWAPPAWNGDETPTFRG